MEEDRKLPAWVLPGLGVLAVIALVAAGLLRETPDLDPSTPEGTVQAYLEAVFAGDTEAASQHTEGECDPNIGGGSPTQGVSASLVSVEGDDQLATVVVQLSQTSEDPISRAQRVAGVVQPRQSGWRLVDSGAGMAVLRGLLTT